MHPKKGWLLTLSAVFILTLVLAGCGAGTSANSTQSTTQKSSDKSATGSNDTSASSNPPSSPPVELNWYLPATPQKDTAKVEQALNNYLKGKLNATIKLHFIDWGSWNDKFPVLLASGDNVDIMFTAGWSQFAESVARGYFLDITNLLPQDAPKTMAMLPKPLVQGATINGKIYAIPTHKELAHTNGFFYSTDLAKKFGVYDQLQSFKTHMPTLQDFEPILKKVKAQDSSIYPFDAVDPNVFLDFDPIGDENVPGKLYPHKDTKVIDEYETPEMMNLLKVERQYYLDGYIRKDAATVKDASTDIKAEKVFLWNGTTKPLANEEVGTQYGYKMDMFSVTKPFITSNDVQGSMNAIAASSKHPDLALKFLELVNTDPNVNNMLNYGVEGVHWVKKGKNVIDFAPGLDAKTTGYAPNAFWEFGNQFLNYFMVGQNTSKWDKFEQYNQSAVPSKILGFNFNAEPVKTEIAAVTNVKDQYWPSLYTGTVDPVKNLPIMIQKMKQAGLDKIIAEKQKQIDAWLAQNNK